MTPVWNLDGGTEQYRYDVTDHLPTVQVNGNGNRTTATYDRATGDLLVDVDGPGRGTSYAYYQSGGQSNGLVMSVTDPDGNVTVSARRIALLTGMV